MLASEGRSSRGWHSHTPAAASADQTGHFAEATRHYCRGISYVMKALRSQPNKRAGDSAVKY